MTDKKKKRARAISQKTGMSHQAAVNQLTQNHAPVQTGPTLLEQEGREYVCNCVTLRANPGQDPVLLTKNYGQVFESELAKLPGWTHEGAKIEVWSTEEKEKKDHPTLPNSPSILAEKRYQEVIDFALALWPSLLAGGVLEIYTFISVPKSTIAVMHANSEAQRSLKEKTTKMASLVDELTKRAFNQCMKGHDDVIDGRVAKRVSVELTITYEDGVRENIEVKCRPEALLDVNGSAQPTPELGAYVVEVADQP